METKQTVLPHSTGNIAETPGPSQSQFQRDPAESPVTHLANQITRQTLELAALKAENARLANEVKHLKDAAIIARDKIGTLQDQLNLLVTKGADRSLTMGGVFNSQAFNSNAFNVGEVVPPIPPLADRDITLTMASGSRAISLIMGEIATQETRDIALAVQGSRGVALTMRDT